MLLTNSTNTDVAGTNYKLEYTITRNTDKEFSGEVAEYGIRCALFQEKEILYAEEVGGITPNYEKVCSMVQKLTRNQVFPVHLQDVIEDLLIAEQEENYYCFL